MSTDHNRIKVADLEKNQQDKILVTDANGELEFQDIKNIKSENYNALDYITEGKALDARQGKVLKDLIDTKTEDKSNKTDDIEANKASSVKYTSAKSVVDWLKSFLFPNLSSKTTTFIDTDLILTGDSEDSFKTKTGTFAQLKANLKTYFDTIFQSVLVSGSNIKTVNGTSLLGNGNIATPDMTTTTAQTVSGVKTFLNLMLGLRNAANTFTSFITNAATASRTWTFPDKSGTVAMTSDITGVINAGTTNRIPKYVGSTVVGNSRIIDDGTFMGLDTVNAPTKDITLSYLSDREIGIESSNSVTKGRDLTVSAGRTINYNDNANFISISQNIGTNTFSIIGLPNGNMYAARYGGDIYKQTNSSGLFIAMPTDAINPKRYTAMAVTTNNDVYDARFGGDIYKQLGGTGLFVALGEPARNWYGMASLPNNNVYASVASGDIYMQTNGTGSFMALNQVYRSWGALAGSPTGNMYAIVQGLGDIYMQSGGSGNFNPLGITQRSYAAITVALNNNVFVAVANGDIYMQTNGTGAFVALNQTFRDWSALGTSSNGNIYATTRNGDIYMLSYSGTGTSDLDGGTCKIKSGTGKGIGKSRTEFYTGQKTVSGTNMQLETLRAYFDENGNYVYLTHPVYANDTEADADSNLPSKAYYKITGNRGIFQKP